MTVALISPVILRWARERAYLDHETLAKSARVKPEKIMLWEEGKEKPTFRQAQTLAKKLCIPLGFLFLPHPPEEKLPIPDLRTVGGHLPGDFSIDMHDLLADVLRKQDWYRDYLLEQGVEPLPFIGRFGIDDKPEEIAADMMMTLDLKLSDRADGKSRDKFQSLLTEKAEAAGVWVIRSGIVGNNTHRPLEVHEFRGFAICDEIAPLVFINGNDARAAQIFTLMHELAHLWIGQSGISDVSLAQPAKAVNKRTEKLCNAVAAEVLVPQRTLKEQWQAHNSVEENAPQLAGFFRVSTVGIARRALDLGLIEWPAYFGYYQQQEQFWQRKKEQQGKGGDYYRTIPVRNGRRFTEAVIRSSSERSLLLRDAGRLLNINPSKIRRLAEKISIG